MKFDKAYVIGSNQVSEKRLNNFFKQNVLKNKKISIWPAINGLNLNIKKYQDLKYLSDNFKINLPGSLGCLLSHVTLWDFCKNDKECDIALIFEDDVIINKNFEIQIKNLDINDLPNDWTMLRLSYKGLIGNPISKSIVKPDLLKKRGVNAGTWCYLLNTQNADTLINELTPYENKNSMDVLLRNNIDNLKIFFTKNNLAEHNENKYSPRKDFNLPKKNIFEFIKITIRKYLYH
ncbi:MAG: glycosyltransferase family 25 protein [Candidatus Neomarinimicrobiota bacterium]